MTLKLDVWVVDRNHQFDGIFLDEKEAHEYCTQGSKEDVTAIYRRKRAQISLSQKEVSTIAALGGSLDSLYRERTLCVAMAAKLAIMNGLRAGRGMDPAQPPDWRTLVVIDLPGGQCSWHVAPGDLSLVADLPDYNETWDGHSTDEKYQRVELFLKQVA